MKIAFSRQISEVGTDSVLHIPGLNAMRQDLLVHVPSGNIMIWKQATVRGEIPQYCSNSQNHDTKWPTNVFGHLKLYECHYVRCKISDVYVCLCGT